MACNLSIAPHFEDRAFKEHHSTLVPELIFRLRSDVDVSAGAIDPNLHIAEVGEENLQTISRHAKTYVAGRFDDFIEPVAGIFTHIQFGDVNTVAKRLVQVAVHIDAVIVVVDPTEGNTAHGLLLHK